MIKIRKAELSDCHVIAIVKKEVWKTTYLGIYPQKKLDEYSIENNEKKFEKMIRNHKQELFVVEDDKRIIGYFSFGEILRPFRDYTHDIGLLYILQDYQRQGIGKMIFSMCREQFLKDEIFEFIVSCHKYNFSAQKFYLKMGGTIIYIEDDDQLLPQMKFLFKNDRGSSYD